MKEEKRREIEQRERERALWSGTEGVRNFDEGETRRREDEYEKGVGKGKQEYETLAK